MVLPLAPPGVIEEIAAFGRFAASRGWVPATAGNFSCRIDAAHAAVTRSGIDKGAIGAADVAVVPLSGPVPPGLSAETPLHLARYRTDPAIGAVFHVHTVAATVLSRCDLAGGVVRTDGFEMHKAIGLGTHESVVEIPVFPNDQDTERARRCRRGAARPQRRRPRLPDRRPRDVCVGRVGSRGAPPRRRTRILADLPPRRTEIAMNATLTSTLRVYDENDPATTLVDTTDRAEIARVLAAHDILFEQWEANAPLTAESDQDSILAAYADDIARLREQYGYTTVDVIRVGPKTENIPALREKFLNEHTHTEDEVRFFVEGSASFYLRTGGKVHQMICTRGDLLSVPANTTHWFDMGPAPEFAAIRLFVDPSGWVANFTGNDIAGRFPKFE